jgi:predicted TIM-barrel fold metal-dependent hydrolase
MRRGPDFQALFGRTRRAFVAGLLASGLLPRRRAMAAQAAAAPAPEPAAAPRRVDVHHHIVPEFYVRAMTAAGLPTVGGVPYPRWNEERMLGALDSMRIWKAIVSVSSPGVAVPDPGMQRDLARQLNEYSADLARRHAARVGAFATVPLASPEAAIAEVGHALDRLRLAGVCLFSNYEGRYLGDPRLDELLAELDRRRAIVFLHPTLPQRALWPDLPFDPPIVEFVFETTRAITNLVFTGALERFPNIRFIVAHLGGTIPFVAWRLRLFEHSPREEFQAYRRRARRPVAEYLARLYYESAMAASPGNLADVLSFVPAQQLLFGSDFPFAAQSMIDLNTASPAQPGVLAADTLRMLEHDNAVRLFGLAPG